jgi:uncharacterized membrane protein
MTSFADRLMGPAFGRAVRIALLFVGVAPFLPLLLEPIPLLRVAGHAIDSWFQFQCHREDGRSFHVLGHTLPVCVRCFGIYLGLGLGALILRPRLSTWPLRIWVGFAALVMVLDVWTELLGMRPESSWLRLLTGILLSYPVGAALVITARGEPIDSTPAAATPG